MIVNEDGDIVHYSARTAKYLEAPYGVPTPQLLTSARKELRLDLRSALREAIETRRAATRDNIAFETDHHVEHVSVSVEPPPGRADGRSAFLIAFEEKELSKDGLVDSREAPHPQEFVRTSPIEAELRDTRERLQGTIEEYETALEELKSANEELISLNEELQTVNQELLA